MFVQDYEMPVLTGSEWVAQRRSGLNALLTELHEFNGALDERQLWHRKDELRLNKVTLELGDYLCAIASAPERSHASHNDQCLSGPIFKLPVSPRSWSLQSYVWRVDAHLRLLKELARNRLAYDRMLKNPPAQPFDQMDWRLKASRAYAPPERFIYDEGENREEFRQYLETMIDVLEAATAAELDTPGFMTARYRLETKTLQVTGATRLRLRRLSTAMSAQELLAETEVAEQLPRQPQLTALSADIIDDELFKRFEKITQENAAALQRYTKAFDAAWRSLTADEIKAVLQIFN